MSTTPARRAAVRAALRFVAVCVLAGVVMTGATGCNGDKSIAIIDKAINELNRQPAAWETTMRNTVDALGKERAAALDQVSNLLSTALGQSSNLGFCGADFVGRRVSQRMQDILHGLDKTRPAPTIVPVVCNTSPADRVDAGKTNLVTFYGYDFVEFAKTRSFSASLKYSDGSVANRTSATSLSPTITS